MNLPHISGAYVSKALAADGTLTQNLVFETSDGNVTVPLSFAWAAADLYASLHELVTVRRAMSVRHAYPFQGGDGRYLRAVAAVKKADNKP